MSDTVAVNTTIEDTAKAAEDIATVAAPAAAPNLAVVLPVVVQAVEYLYSHIGAVKPLNWGDALAELKKL